MYEIAQHFFGKATIRTGPMSGCLGFNEHKWVGIGVVRSKETAIQLAKGCEVHATVVKRFSAEVVFDNGKEPGARA